MQHAKPPHLVSVSGRYQYALSSDRWRAEDGSPLSVTPLSGMDRADIDTREKGLWRYRASLPLNALSPISLGEGGTPLVRQPIAGTSCLVKLEWFSPTGSFKDRGTAVMIAALRRAGVREVVGDSSGNGGASLAAYAAAAGIKVHMVVPATTQPAKITQIRAYGAKVELVSGSREACASRALSISETGFCYASHNWNPFFLQGTKTLGYEIWEDLGFNVPDNIILPVGGGSNLLGCQLAFDELMRAGATCRVPRLFGVQSINCAPIYAHLHPEVGPLKVKRTIAEGIAIERPVRLLQVEEAISGSGGDVVAVTEREITDAVRLLAAQGLFAEPTAASALAGFLVLNEAQSVSKGETTVVVLTGTGLKATAYMSELFPSG